MAESPESIAPAGSMVLGPAAPLPQRPGMTGRNNGAGARPMEPGRLETALVLSSFIQKPFSAIAV